MCTPREKAKKQTTRWTRERTYHNGRRGYGREDDLVVTTFRLLLCVRKILSVYPKRMHPAKEVLNARE
jgi:hypothetical protein